MLKVFYERYTILVEFDAEILGRWEELFEERLVLPIVFLYCWRIFFMFVTTCYYNSYTSLKCYLLQKCYYCCYSCFIHYRVTSSVVTLLLYLFTFYYFLLFISCYVIYSQTINNIFLLYLFSLYLPCFIMLSAYLCLRIVCILTEFCYSLNFIAATTVVFSTTHVIYSILYSYY